MANTLTLSLTQSIIQRNSLKKGDTTISLTVGEARDIITEPIENSLPESLKQVRDLAKLGPNWDSYDGLPPTEEAISKAASFLGIVYEYLRNVANIEARPHRIAALPDGGIQLSWKRPQAETEVELSPKGALSYIYVEKEDGGDESYTERDNAPWWMALRQIVKTLLGHA